MPEVKPYIVGEGDLRPYTTQLTNLQDITVINRWIPDDEVASYFRGADVLVMPYTDASQSGVIPIAYMAKVPVVAARVGGLSEQVDNGKTGLLVPAGNIPELANACVKLLSNPVWAAALGKAGYQKAMTEWSWERVAERVYVTCTQAADYKLRK
ncbi:glycosyltransferase [bacterium]|nr:glycosyltransferase [bacterium]